MSMRDTFNLDPSDMLDFARRWAKLGDAIASQVSTLLECGDAGDLNPNALMRAQEELAGFNETIDTALQDGIDQLNEEAIYNEMDEVDSEY